MSESKSTLRLREAISGLPGGQHQLADISVEGAAALARIDRKLGRLAKAAERIATALEGPRVQVIGPPAERQS